MYVIWNLTRVCPWNCAFCCVAAIHAKNPRDAESKHALEVSNQRQLTFDEKISVLQILATQGVKIDFSGGDPLFYEDDIRVLEKAITLMPPERIDVSMTGSGLTKRKIRILKRVETVEFTLDNLPSTNNPLRPKGFNVATMKAIKKLVPLGINASAVTTLHKHTIGEDNLLKIYQWLCANKVKTWSVLKFYPVGRGISMDNLVQPKERYLEAMQFLSKLNGYTQVIFQHSMCILKSEYACHAAMETVGVLPDGNVSACAWALNGQCSPMSSFSIGKLPEESFDDILKRARQEMGYHERLPFCRITKQ
ncbi:radical SAM protein [Candidatus Kuenenbacteria bacterium]|nr:radical SAM protein [Candidatus Kuenenbacteria bacterium]